MHESFDPYRKWLGILPKDQPPNHYRLLGIELFEPDPDVISHAADARMAHLRTFQSGQHSELSQKLLNEIAAAKVCLLAPEKKSRYDTELRRQLTDVAPVMPVAVVAPASADPTPAPARPASPPPPPEQPASASGVRVVGGASSATAALARRRRSWQTSVVAFSLAAVIAVMALGVILADRLSSETGQADGTAARSSGASPAEDDPVREGSSRREKPRDGDAQRDGPSGDEAGLRRSKEPRDGFPELPAATGDPGSAGGLPAGPGDAPPDSAEVEPAVRLPPPEAAVRAAAEKDIRALYREDLDSASAPESMLALAGKLIAEGEGTNDNPAARYVLFRMAADLAAQAGDLATVATAVDRMARFYEVSGAEAQAEVLERAASAAVEESARRTVELLQQGAEAAEAEEAYAAAERLAKAAVGPARKTRDHDFVRDVVRWGREVEQRAAQFAEVQQHLKRLGEQPDDAGANLAVGRWYGLVLNDWEKALPCLANGGDAEIAAAARRDLAGPSDASARLEAGDAWWEAAENRPGDERIALQGRAVHWYERAVSDLTGISRTQTERRIEAYRTAIAGDEEDAEPGQYALLLDGQKGHVVVPGFRYDGTTPLSVEVICTPLSNNDSCTVIGNLNAAGGWGVGMFDLRAIGLKNRHWAFLVRTQSRRRRVAASGSVSVAEVNRRVMLAAVFDGDEARLYLDGRKQPSVLRVAGPHAPGPQLLMIGAAPGVGHKPQDFFHGTIEQVRVSLTARFSSNYTPPGRLESDDDTALLLHFDAGKGTVVRDSSGKRLVARIVGAEWVERAP